MSAINTPRRDPNSVVTVGMSINGKIIKKLGDFVVIGFNVGNANCSGVLHVAEFPSLDRAERDAMFGVAEEGMPAPGLVVISVTPPAEGKYFTKVRLSALKPIKDALPPKPAAEKKKKKKKDGSTLNRDARRNGANNGGKGGQRNRNGSGNRPVKVIVTESAPSAVTIHADELNRSGPRGSGTSTPPAVKATVFSPLCTVDKAIAAKPKNEKPVKKAKPAAAKPTVTVALTNPLDAARALVKSMEQPADSVGDFSDLGRAMALRNARADGGFMDRIRSIAQGLSFVDECVTSSAAIAAGMDPKVLAAATKVAAARAEGTKLDSEAATIKGMSARYAGLCKKAMADEGNEALQSEKATAKSDIDSRREKLAANRDANKKALDDADMELVFAVLAGAGADEYEAPVANAAKLLKLTADVADKTAWLGKMVARSERHLEPKQS